MRFTKSLGKPLPYRPRTASFARLPLVLTITAEMYHIVIHEWRSGTILLSTVEATAVDLVGYMHRAGGVDRVAGVLPELGEDMGPERLVEAL